MCRCLSFEEISGDTAHCKANLTTVPLSPSSPSPLLYLSRSVLRAVGKCQFGVVIFSVVSSHPTIIGHKRNFVVCTLSQETIFANI